MGGYGSGRTGNSIKTEDCRTLDVNTLHRHGCLEPSWSGQWEWSRAGQRVAQIDLKAELGRIILSYRVSINGGEREAITQFVPILRQPCNYGGTRPYFRCPGVVNSRTCNRRVGKLFVGGRYFLCRHCYRLAYRSQTESREDRLLRRANQLRMGMGGEAGTASLTPSKPKGMWHRTYARRMDEIWWCEDQAAMAFITRCAHLLPERDRERMFGLTTD